jgi:hypothetical protein
MMPIHRAGERHRPRTDRDGGWLPGIFLKKNMHFANHAMDEALPVYNLVVFCVEHW